MHGLLQWSHSDASDAHVPDALLALRLLIVFVDLSRPSKICFFFFSRADVCFVFADTLRLELCPLALMLLADKL